MAGGQTRGRYVFPARATNEQGEDEPMPHVTAEKGFKRALLAAELPDHFSPHSMRHSFASLLLQRGESPAYLQEQLGHASIELTVGTYGRWLRKRPTIGSEALDRPDSEPSGSKTAEVVAGSAAGGGGDGSPDPSSDLYLKAGGEGGDSNPRYRL